MTSAINTTNIDAEYPVAGVDNNSQGFRDNFSNIKTGLTTAKSEISDLQSKTLKSSKLSPETGIVENDLQGSAITNGTHKKFYGSVASVTADENGAIAVNLNNGPLQYITLGTAPSNTFALSFTNWPANNLYAKVTLHISSNNTTNKTINFAIPPKKESTFPSPFTIASSTDVKIIEVWTYNAGINVYVKLIGTFA